jgi:hypothetical protein
MKKILALLTLLTCINLNAQEFRPDSWCKHLLTDEIIRFSNQHFPQPPRVQPIIYIRATPLNPNFIATAEILSHNQYIINVNPMYMMAEIELERTMIHELQHVLQFYHNRLKTLEQGFLYDDQIYSFNWPYDQRPWELEADSVSALWCD